MRQIVHATALLGADRDRKILLLSHNVFGRNQHGESIRDDINRCREIARKFSIQLNVNTAVRSPLTTNGMPPQDGYSLHPLRPSQSHAPQVRQILNTHRAAEENDFEIRPE